MKQNLITDVIQGMLDIVKKLTLNKKIEEQQYSCAVMKFYLDSLGEFLGL